MQVVLGEELQRARIERGQSIRAAALELGVSHTALGNWERGVFAPEAEHLDRIAAYVGRSPAVVRKAWSNGQDELARRRVERSPAGQSARIEAELTELRAEVAELKSALAELVERLEAPGATRATRRR